MAQRRMFSPQIIDSDAFLDMPTSAQSLYFHLGMRADDDGFVGNPKRIMKTVGGNEDDLKILIGKRFVLIFETGVIVIKHWRINNLVRKDWYKETTYIEEKKSLKVKENGAYTELVNELGNENATTRQRRLGKVRLGKVNIVKEDNTILAGSKDEKPEKKNTYEKVEDFKNKLKAKTANTLDELSPENIKTKEEIKGIIEIMDIFRTINPTLNYGNRTNRQSCQDLVAKFGIANAIKMAKYAVQVQGQDYAPTITNPYQLKEKLAQLKIYSDKTNKAKMTSI